MNKKEKITIELKEWDHTCGDGCCYTYGIEIYVNGKLIEGEDGYSSKTALSAVLEHLGYEVEINLT